MIKVKLKLIFLSILISTTSCGFTPLFSELQDSRTLGANGFEVTPSLTAVASDVAPLDPTQYEGGFSLGYGVTDRVDVRGRYSYAALSQLSKKQSVIDVHMASIGVKYGLIENTLAGYLAVGTAFGAGDVSPKELWQIHPTIIYSVPISQTWTASWSSKVLLPVRNAGWDEINFAGNAGATIKVSQGMKLRPEVGALFSNDFEDVAFQGSLGVSFDKW